MVVAGFVGASYVKHGYGTVWIYIKILRNNNGIK